MKKIIRMAVIALITIMALTFAPAGSTDAQAAAKPGAVVKIKKVKATQNSLKIKYNKVSNKSGYQVRAFIGKKLVKSANTKKASYTIKGLKPATKYTVKVRAYGKKGGRTVYGKEKKIAYKTLAAKTDNGGGTDTTTTTDTDPAPTETVTETVTEETTVVTPGMSTSTGADLVAEYDAWIAYCAEQNVGTKDLAWMESTVTLGHFGSGINYVKDCPNDKYEAFKTAEASLDTITEIFADYAAAMGLEVTMMESGTEWDKYVQAYAKHYGVVGEMNKIVMFGLEDGKYGLYKPIPYESNTEGWAPVISRATASGGPCVPMPTAETAE